jgi:C-terminal processing protease CtpA/Prc
MKTAWFAAVALALSVQGVDAGEIDPQKVLVAEVRQVFAESIHQGKVEECLPVVDKMTTAAYIRYQNKTPVDAPGTVEEARMVQECFKDLNHFALTPDEHTKRRAAMLPGVEVQISDGVYVVRLERFAPNAGLRMLEALASIGDAPLVVDLRGNPGGLLAEQGVLLNAFAEYREQKLYGQRRAQEEIVYTAGGLAPECVADDIWISCHRASRLTEPLAQSGALSHLDRFVVLINGGTGSAGENTALWWKKNRDAVLLVGEPTYGKWQIMTRFTVRVSTSISEEFSIILTTGEGVVYGLNGEKFSVKNSVQPDIFVEDEVRQLEVAVQLAKELKKPAIVAHQVP